MTFGLLTSNTIQHFIGQTRFNGASTSLAAYVKKLAILHEHVLIEPNLLGMDIFQMVDEYEFFSTNFCENQEDVTGLVESKACHDLFYRPGWLAEGLEVTTSNNNLSINKMIDVLGEDFDIFEGLEIEKLKESIIHNPLIVADAHGLLVDYGILLNIREVEPNVIGAFSDLHHSLFPKISEKAHTNVGTQYCMEHFNNTVFPDFGVLSWKEIFDLRNNEFIGNFRKKFVQTYEASPNSNINELGDLVSEIWGYVKETKPNIAGTVIEGVVSSFPFISEVTGPAIAAKQVLKSRKLANQYGWLYFIQASQELKSQGE